MAKTSTFLKGMHCSNKTHLDKPKIWAKGYRGPRKEFFKLMLLKAKEDYFDNGLKENQSEEYEVIGFADG